MSKLTKALLSFSAKGSLGKALSFRTRGSQTIAEKKPIPEDAKSELQLQWRHMYQKAVALWHALSAEEKEDWESNARIRHMTGFAWFMSQCLKPNPGIYLPLQGGTMSGDIDMATHRILNLPEPTANEEPTRKIDATFLKLSDTPGSYAGEAGKCPKVNAGEDALEFAAAPAGPSITTGSYIGDDSSDRQIAVGFKCSMVILMTPTNAFRWIVIPDITMRDYNNSHNTVTTDAVLHATDGFVVDREQANIGYRNYYYWAISH